MVLKMLLWQKIESISAGVTRKTGPRRLLMNRFREKFNFSLNYIFVLYVFSGHVITIIYLLYKQSSASQTRVERSVLQKRDDTNLLTNCKTSFVCSC